MVGIDILLTVQLLGLQWFAGVPVIGTFVVRIREIMTVVIVASSGIIDRRLSNRSASLPGPSRFRAGGSRRLGRLGALHVTATAGFAKQIPRDTAFTTRARPTGLVGTVAGVTAPATAVTAPRVRGKHMVRHGYGKRVTAQLARHGLLGLVVGHKSPEYPLVVSVRGRIH